MTNAGVAAVFESVVAERRARHHAPMALRYRQMERIAVALREHPDDDKWDDGVRAMLPTLDELQLLGIEVVLMQWYPAEASA